MMTEEEAKTKWCCANMSFPIEVTVAYQAQPIMEYTQKCQGAQCMAWRATDNEIKENPSGPVVHGRARNANDYVSAGFCGLAGKP